jgi:tetratricopeptide (TPR) repeat protein
MSDRHLEVLLHLVSHAGTLLSKDALVSAAWGDVAVTDNSLEQAISALRRTLRHSDETPLIETVPRRGYRFAGVVTRVAARESDAGLDALLAPHRAWLEGRAALQTLARDQIELAGAAFQQVLQSEPEHPLAHIGLANASVLRFETTRTDRQPDTAALASALEHAREACRLEPDSGEGWATLGFVLDRTGAHLDALAALRRATTLEPDNWRHHFRLSYVSWGEERLRSARRTLALLPDFPLAHWMIASVLVARNVLGQAEEELDAGIAAEARRGEQAPFSAVGLQWLRGLILLARGDDQAALDAFERELACEVSGHLYARECCANTWYAIGVLHWRAARLADSRAAFEQTVRRVAAHPLARIAQAAVDGSDPRSRGVAATFQHHATATSGVDAAFARAAVLVLQADSAGAASEVARALAEAPPGSAGWLLPIEPLLHVTAAAQIWAPALDRLRARAS